MTSPFGRSVDAIARDRAVMRACERSASMIARFCPVDAVERYVAACTRAECMARMSETLVNLISAFVAPSIVLGFCTAIGVIPASMFIVLWTWIGLDQCTTHIVAVHATLMSIACKELADTASVEVEFIPSREGDLT
ncbi:hypothetical protein [Paraburkholderia bannensis]|uniref:hypothetical protein n=1 Tax=Paraburkholderia bannensis TaxID=765414 RepID=UPI002AC31982|nr:hypothetical protein [Paraburkholderia bannensis]